MNRKKRNQTTIDIVDRLTTGMSKIFFALLFVVSLFLGFYVKGAVSRAAFEKSSVIHVMKQPFHESIQGLQTNFSQNNSSCNTY